jgi:signal peptidase II
MKNRLQNLAAWLAVTVVCVAADQFTKHLVVEKLAGREPIVLIPGVFELLYTENRGAAFGMLQGKQGFFFVIAAVVLLAAAWVMYRLPDFSHSRYHLLKLCVAWITAGAVGNMIDRLSQGYVVDFLYFRLIDFPVFNVADIFVTCATALLMILMLFYYKDEDLECLRVPKTSGKGDLH